MHTVYVPGHKYRAGLAQQWGADAQAAVTAFGGIARLVEALDVPDAERGIIAERVSAKLATEAIEDLRIDFEDGFGDQGDAAEDAAVVLAATELAQDVAAGEPHRPSWGFDSSVSRPRRGIAGSELWTCSSPRLCAKRTGPFPRDSF